MNIDVKARRAEAERLRTLQALRVLDSMPDGFTDSVAVAAAAVANTPISAVSLIDVERQWFKASCGLDVSETSRSVAFCAHTILTREPLIVPDALLDTRFAVNPLVTSGPRIRFYAGFPLIVKGQALGALCVIDDRVRQLTGDQIERLAGLAGGTAAWLGRYVPG